MRLGIIIKDLQFGQVPMLLTIRLNNKKYNHDDITIFYEEKSFNLTKTNFPTFPVYYTSHMNDGFLVATNLEQADYISNIQTSTKKYYYVQDLDWLRIWGRDFDNTRSIYEKINLLCPSEEYQKEIQRFCGKKASIVKDFDIDKMIEVLKNESISSR